jgi:hypothetical protein
VDETELIEGLTAREHGFTHIREAAAELWQWNAASQVHKLARQLFIQPEYQKRMCAVYLFGMLAIHDAAALAFLRDDVARDANWRVQEVLAQAFDYYCRQTGYEQALPAIQDWLRADNPNTRRAVTEGLRVWTRRPYFREHPEHAVALILPQLDSPSEYLRKSAANSLRDISRTHPRLAPNGL